MCYEDRFYAEWARKAALKREQSKPATDTRKPDLSRDQPKQEPAKPREVELETV